MNGKGRLIKEGKTLLIIDTPRNNNDLGESYIFTFKYKYLEQALFFNHHFLVIILVGLFGMIFTPLKTQFEWINESIEFINAIMLGVGVSGVICWCFTFKTKGSINHSTWMVSYVLLNICHILSVFFFLGYFFTVGIKPDGSVSALICGTFVSLIVGIVLSMKYVYKN